MIIPNGSRNRKNPNNHIRQIPSQARGFVVLGVHVLRSQKVTSTQSMLEADLIGTWRPSGSMARPAPPALSCEVVSLWIYKAPMKSPAPQVTLSGRVHRVMFKVTSL